MIRLLCSIFLVTGIISAESVFAESYDIESNILTIDTSAKILTYKGNVRLKHEGLTIKADRLTIKESSGNRKQGIKMYGVVITGVITKNDVDPQPFTISGKRAVFNNKNLIEIRDNVVLEHEDHTITAEIMIYNRALGTFSAKQKGSKRVRMSIKIHPLNSNDEEDNDGQ